MRFLSFYAYPHPLEIKIKEWIIACVYQIRCGNEHNHDHINNRQNMGTGRHLSGELLCQIFHKACTSDDGDHEEQSEVHQEVQCVLVCKCTAEAEHPLHI